MKTKRNWKRLAQVLFVLVSVALFFLQIDMGTSPESGITQEYLEGEITGVSESESIQSLDVVLMEGPNAGETVSLSNNLNSYANAIEYLEGDEVMLLQSSGSLELEQLFIVDYVRYPKIYLLFALFVGVVLVINGKKGIYSLLSMAFSFLVLFKLILPLLLKGVDPVLAVLFGSLFILPAIFYLSHGVNRKTSIAITGTLITLALTGFLATIFTELIQLNGLATEEAGFLKVGIGENINFRGLLLGGMIISVLGVLDDVSITQTSVVEQLKAAQNKISFKELYRRSMAVGRDHIASVVNTLILVYTGASLPLLLLFVDSSETFNQIINYEFMAEEITRTLVGSIGLIFAVPITTLIACFVFNKGKDLKLDELTHVH
ncbi:MAG: putative membrane protein [Oceanicoccus sp.]|jgi:uncharacterized membrane protein